MAQQLPQLAAPPRQARRAAPTTVAQPEAQLPIALAEAAEAVADTVAAAAAEALAAAVLAAVAEASAVAAEASAAVAAEAHAVAAEEVAADNTPPLILFNKRENVKMIYAK